MAYASLLDPEKSVMLTAPKKPAKNKKNFGPPGCGNCPLDKSSSKLYTVNKVIGLERITGQKIMLWAQSPGAQENEKGLELIGPAGDWLWKELSRVGISRENCDVQNVCRCRPFKISAGRRVDREPTEEELYHCSVYNDQALERNRDNAVVHLVLGKVARSFLGREFRGDRPVFWSPKLQAMVVCAAHPSYFIRGNYPDWALAEFRDRLQAAKLFVEFPGQYGYVNHQDYKPVSTAAKAKALKTTVRKWAAAGHRISVDVEEGQTAGGEPCLLMVGFSWDSGHARSLILEHPENTARFEDKAACWDVARELMADRHVQKTFQYGSSDVREFARYGVKVRGYTYDTLYSSYFRWPFKRKYGLAEMSVFAFPEFAGYRDMVAPFVGEGNYANVPLDVLQTYNCADADLTKRLEGKTSPHINHGLLQVYISAAFVIDQMEKRGPIFDSEYQKYVTQIVPKGVESLAEKIRVMAGDPDLNPNTPAQIARVMYDVLGLESPDPERPRTTAEDVMLLLAKQHPFPRLVLDYRKLFKMETTYLQGYQKSAEINGGELRTRWHLTGTITGRLRSGGKDDGDSGIVNFQNFHGNALIQNLLVSDREWRKVKQPNFRGRLRVFFALDYSQIEIRVLAMLAEDPLLISQLNSGVDIHCLVGNALTGWPLEVIKKDKEKRTLIKQLHFGIVYGLSEASAYADVLERGVKISKTEFGKLFKSYFAKYSGVKAYIDRMRFQAEKDGYVETMFGFRRELGSWDDSRQSYWGNQAVNTPIQGSAHQLILIAMANIHQKPKTYNLLQNAVMEIHDALYFFGGTQDLDAVYKQGKHLMEQSVPEYVQKHFGLKIPVPLLAEGTAGYRMGVMIDYQGQDPEQFVLQWLDKNAKVDAKIIEDFGAGSSGIN